ncbi:MAG: hypothetical protein JXA72_09585 [Bacteroidales bacterium]|nr:hypothetical protein [Bacteroidales bacterium]
MKLRFISTFILVCYTGIMFSQQFELLKIDPKFEISMKNDLAIDKMNNLWVATDKGVLEFVNNKWNLYQNDSIKFQHIDKLFIDSQNRIWCISYLHNTLSKSYFGGLYMIDNERNIIDFSDKFESIFITDINEDAEGKIWVTTGKMLAGVTNKKNHTFNTSLDMIKGIPITDIASDIVAKNAPGGVYKFDGSNWNCMTSDAMIPIKFVSKIIKGNDALFFCEERGGKERLIKYSGNEFIDISSKGNYPGDEVHDIVSDCDGDLWILTADNRLKVFKIDRNNTINEFYKMNPYRLGIGRFYKFGDHLCLTYLGTFIEFNKTTNTWICPQKQSNQNIKYFIKDVTMSSDGSYYIADGKGIRIYKDGSFIDTRIFDKIKIGMLFSVQNDKILVGTKDHGLYLLNRGKLEKINKDLHDQDMPLGYSNIKLTQGNVSYFLTTNGILKVVID